MPRSPDFFKKLNEQALEALEDYARQPGRTGDEVVTWLSERQVTASRTAVYRWLQDFRLEDRTRRASEVARQYLDVLKEADPTAVTEASLKKFDELVFDYLVNSDGSDALELRRIAGAMKASVGTRRENDELKRRQGEAVKQADAAAKSGASGEAVVAKVREILGIAA